MLKKLFDRHKRSIVDASVTFALCCTCFVQLYHCDDALINCHGNSTN